MINNDQSTLLLYCCEDVKSHRSGGDTVPPLPVYPLTLTQQADIRMHSHGVRQFVDDKSVASCQQTCCKFVVKTCYLQELACCKLF